jgi:hypothetical protein
VKVRPTRFAQAGKNILRDRIVAEAEVSAKGRRIVKECLAALERPANQDSVSRRLVFSRYADELDLFPHELEDLLKRTARSPST